MDDIVKRFTLDLQKNSSSEVVYASKSDIGRTIHVSIVNNGMPLYFTDSTTAMLSAIKDNDLAIVEQCNISGNIVRYEISASMTEYPREIPCEIILYDASGYRITTPAFTILVSDTNYDDGDPVADPVEPTVVLMSPGNCQVGQYFKISEVSEDGRAVKLIPSDGTPGPQGEPGQDGQDGQPGADGAPGQDGKDGRTPEKGVDYFTETDKEEIVEDVKASINPFTEVHIDIPDAGVESYYLALNEDNSGVVVTQDAERSMDVYAESTEGGCYIYTLIGDEKWYFNLITDADPYGYALQTTPVTVYEFLEKILCYAPNEYGYAMVIYDGAVGFDTIEPGQYYRYSCNFISKDTNEVVFSPDADTPYRFGILYGYPEADIKLTGDVRETGEYVLSVSNTASSEPVIITGVAKPKNPQDVANMEFVEEAIANVNAGDGTGTGTQGPQGEPGQDGKSAYEYAVEGGYTGTEAEFATKMALNFVTLTQAEYDALDAPDPNTYYFIKGDS